MNHLQKWFEKIAGISQEEGIHRHFAQEIFGKQQFDSSAFQKPACWRRKAAYGSVTRTR